METKICTKCNRELPIEDFHWRNKEKGTRRAECKYCRIDHMLQVFKDKKSIIAEMKSEIKCQKCGEDKSYMLDFHHIDPNEKDESIAKMVHHTYGMKKVLNEIEKCTVLCANCHREFHYLEENCNITIDEYLNNEQE